LPPEGSASVSQIGHFDEKRFMYRSAGCLRQSNAFQRQSRSTVTTARLIAGGGRLPGDTREASHRTPMSERDSLQQAEQMRPALHNARVIIGVAII